MLITYTSEDPVSEIFVHISIYVTSLTLSLYTIPPFPKGMIFQIVVF
jgi:hypothetical protein